MNRTIVGKKLPRIDSLAKVTGEAKYSVDNSLPRLLCGKLFRSERSHAKIVHIDTTKAEKLLGVKAVMTANDTPHHLYGLTIRDESVLPRDKVRYIGEPLAAVAAVDEETAEEALELISVEYQDLPALFDPLEAMKVDSPKIHEQIESYGIGFLGPGPGEEIIKYDNICCYIQINQGDVDNAFQEADLTVEDSFKTQRAHQCYGETHSAIASFDQSGKVTIWASNQGGYFNQLYLADALQMPKSKIRVISPFVGGAFGGKTDSIVAPFCVLLARKANRPVKITMSREEEFIAGRPRHPSIIQLKTGVRKDGKIIARQVKIIVDTGAYAHWGPFLLLCATLFARGVYMVPNVKIDGYCVYTNKVVSGAYGGFGSIQVTFACESHMDDIAFKLGIDPVEFRLLNAIKEGDMLASGHLIPGGVGMKSSLLAASQKANWHDEQRKKLPMRGMGIGCMSQVGGLGGASSSALVKINDDGTVDLLMSGVELGQGIKTALAQILAQEMGVALEDVTLYTPDTDATPFDFFTSGTRGILNTGNAVQMAAEEARERIFQLAASLLEANVNDLEARDRKIFVKGYPERSLSIAELASHCNHQLEGPVLGRGFFNPKGYPHDPKLVKGMPQLGLLSLCYSTHVAEVELDADTGKVKVLKVICAHDCGLAINPMGVEGQIEGAVSRGIGYVLTEDLSIEEEGQIIPTSFKDYYSPLATETPEILSLIVEEAKEIGPYGAKGIGEPAIVSTAPAIANAIFNAAAIRIKELPITPEKVFEALSVSQNKPSCPSGGRPQA